MVGYLLGAMVSLSPISWQVSGALLLGALATAMTSWATARPLTKVAARRRQLENTALSLATDFAQGSRVIKGLGAKEIARQRFSDAAQDALTAMLKEAKRASLMAWIRQMVPATFAVGILAWTSWETFEGRIAPGGMMAITMLVPPALTCWVSP